MDGFALGLRREVRAVELPLIELDLIKSAGVTQPFFFVNCVHSSAFHSSVSRNEINRSMSLFRKKSGFAVAPAPDLSGGTVELILRRNEEALERARIEAREGKSRRGTAIA